MQPKKYLPYGEELTSSTLGSEKMRFTGHERDEDPAGHGNDLDYMHARFYSSRMGRFLSLDRVLGRAEAPQSWNRYGYTLGNPMRLVDPDGNEPEEPGFIFEALRGFFRGGLDEAFPSQPLDENDVNVQAAREIGASPSILPQNQAALVQDGLKDATASLAAGGVIVAATLATDGVFAGEIAGFKLGATVSLSKNTLRVGVKTLARKNQSKPGNLIRLVRNLEEEARTLGAKALQIDAAFPAEGFLNPQIIKRLSSKGYTFFRTKTGFLVEKVF